MCETDGESLAYVCEVVYKVLLRAHHLSAAVVGRQGAVEREEGRRRHRLPGGWKRDQPLTSLHHLTQCYFQPFQAPLGQFVSAASAATVPFVLPPFPPVDQAVQGQEPPMSVSAS